MTLSDLGELPPSPSYAAQQPGHVQDILMKKAKMFHDRLL